MIEPNHRPSSRDNTTHPCQQYMRYVGALQLAAAATVMAGEAKGADFAVSTSLSAGGIALLMVTTPNHLRSPPTPPRRPLPNHHHPHCPPGGPRVRGSRRPEGASGGVGGRAHCPWQACA